MNQWKNLDESVSFQRLLQTKPADLPAAMAGEGGKERVKTYQVPMAAGLTYSYAAKQVDDTILKELCALADEMQLAAKFEELYNGAVINTGEKRLVLHHLTRGQLGKTVHADGKDKRAFYSEQQKKIAEFAAKVHKGEILNEKGEKFTAVVQIGIGGSDLVPGPCIWHWKTGRGRTVPSEWKQSLSAMWIRTTRPQFWHPLIRQGRFSSWYPNPVQLSRR